MKEKEWSIPIDQELINELICDFALGALNARGQRLVEAEVIARLNGLKIEIFSNEHPPPHFRVYYNGQSNNFTIKDCIPLNGNGLSKFFRNIQKWHQNNKQQLIDTWNRTRPFNCPVGLYKE